jgi:hypothetical protein
VYSVNGVCHQSANCFLFSSGQTLDATQVRGAIASYALYGMWGTAYLSWYDLFYRDCARLAFGIDPESDKDQADVDPLIDIVQRVHFGAAKASTDPIFVLIDEFRAIMGHYIPELGGETFFDEAHEQYLRTRDLLIDQYVGPELVARLNESAHAMQVELRDRVGPEHYMTLMAVDLPSTTLDVVDPTLSLAAGAPLPAPVDEAAFVSQTVPTTMTAGERYPVSVTMRNTGTTLWKAANERYGLGSQDPEDDRWQVSRVYVPADVWPAEEVVFAFEVVAPASLDAPVAFRWKMIRENVGWFGERNLQVLVTVVKDARFVAQLVEPSMVAGTSMNVSITMHNISDVSWPQGQVRLGSQSPDPTTWGSPQIELPRDVPKHTEVTIAFPVRAPTAAGQYDFQWRMIRGTEWIGQKSPKVAMRVMPRVSHGAAVVSQDVPMAVAPGSTHTVSVTMRNVGTTTWTTAGQYKLAAANTTRWGITRVALPHDVPPNTAVTFAFAIRASDSVGTMDFSWQMVQDNGIGKFGQITPTIAVTVAVIRWVGAFQANGGDLWVVGAASADNRGTLGLGLAPGTSPSVAGLSTAGWVAAFQANTGMLWVVGADDRGSLELGMKPATSPSITAAADGGWQTAFQANGGELWVVGAGGPGALNLGMAPGSSPSIASLATGGWVAAFQANTGMLSVVGTDNRGSLELGMKPGTSPSITAIRSGGWTAAFQANGGDLWVVGSGGPGPLNLGMAPGSSPSIASLATGGWVAAFQANTGMLWVVGTDNRGSLELGMKPGTSPSITATPGGGWEVAFQANDGTLWMIGADNRGPLRLGMAAGTSPSVTRTVR